MNGPKRSLIMVLFICDNTFLLLRTVEPGKEGFNCRNTGRTAEQHSFTSHIFRFYSCPLGRGVPDFMTSTGKKEFWFLYPHLEGERAMAVTRAGGLEKNLSLLSFHFNVF